MCPLPVCPLPTPALLCPGAHCRSCTTSRSTHRRAADPFLHVLLMRTHAILALRCAGKLALLERDQPPNASWSCLLSTTRSDAPRPLVEMEHKTTRGAGPMFRAPRVTKYDGVSLCLLGPGYTKGTPLRCGSLRCGSGALVRYSHQVMDFHKGNNAFIVYFAAYEPACKRLVQLREARTR